ncbi:hypothetical protein BKA62DRAFT_449336 [Auriculariales sp. MPI-PUGE-AT-0066]|nr:hypothetical protein BKA62DRAFT_449336 [Auriculariales sp. MPI-PUGE-AT-0066]
MTEFAVTLMTHRVQHPALALNTILTFSLLSVVTHFISLTTAKFVLYDDDNPAITWSPSAIQPTELCIGNPNRPSCDGFWCGALTHQSWGPDTSFSFSFNGSSFMIVGPRMWIGANGTVTVDGTMSGSFSTLGGGREAKQTLYTQLELDETKEHTVVVAYDNKTYGKTPETRRYLGIDYVLVNQTSATGTSAVTESTVTVTVSATATTESPAMSGTSLGVAISISISSVLIILAAIILFFRMKRKRRKARLDFFAHTEIPSRQTAYPLVSESHWFVPIEGSAPPTDFAPTVAPYTAPTRSAPEDEPVPPYRKARI